MKLFNKKLIYLLPVFWLMSCDSDDDGSPGTIELITAHSWNVSSFEVQAEGISDELLAPFLDDLLGETLLSGTITFEENTYTVNDQGVTTEGTWSLSDDETEITLNTTGLMEPFVFRIKQITSSNFDLSYSGTQDFGGLGTPITVTFEATIFLVPA